MIFETTPPLEQKPGNYSPDITALQILQQRAREGDTDAREIFISLCEVTGYAVSLPETVEV